MLKPAQEYPVPRSMPFERTSTPAPPSQERPATWTSEQACAAMGFEGPTIPVAGVEGPASAAAGVDGPAHTAIAAKAKASADEMQAFHRRDSVATASSSVTP